MLIKKIKKNEIENVELWLQDKMTIADLARKLKINPRHMQVYVRIALTVRELYRNKTLIKIKQ